MAESIHQQASAVTGAGSAQPKAPSHGDAVTDRTRVLLRLAPAVRDALARWANDERRSTNAQIGFLLRRALADADRLPRHAGQPRPAGDRGPARPEST